jgi:hypothetical protein
MQLPYSAFVAPKTQGGMGETHPDPAAASPSASEHSLHSDSGQRVPGCRTGPLLCAPGPTNPSTVGFRSPESSTVIWVGLFCRSSRVTIALFSWGGAEQLKAVLAAHGSVNQGVGGTVVARVPNPDLTPPCGAEPYLIVGMIMRLHATARSAGALLGVWKVFILRNCCSRVGTGGGWVLQKSSIPLYSGRSCATHLPLRKELVAILHDHIRPGDSKREMC